MKNRIKELLVLSALSGFPLLLAAQQNPPARIAPADAKNHISEDATVCGKVVEAKVAKYGLAGHGRPVSFYLDQTEANAPFHFVTFGSKPEGPKEAVAAYDGKQVCVSGQINQVSGETFILATDRSQIKLDTPAK